MNNKVSIHTSFTRVITFFICLLASLCGILFFATEQQWIDVSILEHYDPGTPTIILDDTGNEWTRFQKDQRNPVPLNKIPLHLINAFIATEDNNFFSHHGISLRAIARSLIKNILSRSIVQGASTITQQLVKLLFLTNERSFSRKIKEIFFTLLIEHQFSKEQILETYLNHIYFGSGIYGIEAAAKRFWNISSENLNYAQAATLAGIIKNPNHYCPLNTKNSAHILQRRNLVLKLMVKKNYLSYDDYQLACTETITCAPLHTKNRLGLHAQEMIRSFLENTFEKENLYTSGLIVKTTLNSTLQKQAETSLYSHIKNLRTNIAQLEGALVSLDTQTAAIKALVGGYNFSESQFNRATQAQRQMGSIFKPIVYAAALNAGKDFSTIEIDEPMNFIPNWNPRNVNRIFTGPMTLARALVSSNNIIPIKLLLEIGAEKIIALAKKFHLPGPFTSYPSLALGCTESSPLQAAAYYNTLVNKGMYYQPYFIEWVKNKWGTKIWKHRPEGEQIISFSISSQIIQVLKLITESLKKRMPSWWIKPESMGKTGTTNNNRSCWFAGATPSYTTVVYLGCDDNSALHNKLYSVHHAVPLWLEFNRNIPHKQTLFVHDPQLKKLTIHPFTGKQIDNNTVAHGITILTTRS